MEKHLAALGYWLGLICTAVALIFRLLIALNVFAPRIGLGGGIGLSYLTFFHGAGLFFLLSIASWCRAAKS
ncbi:MAG: hypothetical protein M3P45_08940 [Acidobacteriota bacterium]|nr:hypothetical protein [Acidobacteriota bacterium]